MNYILHLLVTFEIYMILALGLGLIVGHCGMLSLAHAVLFGAGAYAAGLVTTVLGWGFVPGTIAGVACAAVLSLSLSLPAWRFRGEMLVIISLAVQGVGYSGFYNWHSPGQPVGSLRNLTNGSFGISGIPAPTFFGFELDGVGWMVGIATIAAIAAVILIARLERSPWGRLLIAMRDDELAARGLGKNTRLAKVQALLIAGALAGLAGALFSAHARYIDPTLTSLDQSILILSMVLLGGTGNLAGPIAGAAALVILPELLQAIGLPHAIAANLRLLIFGAVLVLLVHRRPQGLLGSHRIE